MGPLEGLRVVELSDTQAGCAAGMLLADYGAEVVRVDSPGSTRARALPGFLVWNRGKESVSLNLAVPEGRELLFRLLEDADVLVETFEAGEAEALGLDPDTTRERFPRLVHCSITGYDRGGPDWGRPGYDGLVQAKVGVMATGPTYNGVPPGWAQAGHRPQPIYMGFPAATYAAAFSGTLGVLAAIEARSRTGRGQHVNSSLHSSLWAMTRRALAENVAVEPLGARRGLYGIWECGDGEWVWTHTGARGSFDRYMKVFGLDEYRTDRPDPIAWDQAVTDELRAKVGAILKTKPRDHWIRLFEENDCPNAATRRPGEAYDDEQVSIVHAATVVDDPDLGPLEEVAPPINFAKTPGALRRSAPRPGEHTEQVLGRLGVGAGEVTRLRGIGAL